MFNETFARLNIVNTYMPEAFYAHGERGVGKMQGEHLVDHQLEIL